MKLLIAVPCMDMMHTAFVHSLLSIDKDEETEVVFVASSLVYDSRNQLVSKALDGEYDRILWTDSDMVFNRESIAYLKQDLDAGYDIVAGLCFSRKPPIRPVVCKTCELVKLEDGRLDPVSERYLDYPRNTLFEVAAMGFGFVAMNVSALRRVADKYGRMLFMPLPGFGEDLSFCLRARNAGERLWCDSRATIGHVGQMIYDEDVYMRNQ